MLALLCAAGLRAAEPVPESAWRVWLEPKSMRPRVSEPVTGAARTVRAAGFLDGDGLTPFARAAFAAQKLDWATFSARAAVNAAADLATLQPRYERDRKKVIQYAELTSTQPLVASAVLAPGFLARFKDTLGDAVLLVVPNRFTAYVFPQLASNYQDFYPLIFSAYRATPFPVSVEVFEVSASGWRAVGVYRGE